MRLNCTSFRTPNDWEIPKEFQNTIKEWMSEEHYPFSYRNATMADVWFLSAMLGFKQRRKGAVDGQRVKSIPCHVFSEGQVLALRLAATHMHDNEFKSFLDDKDIYDTMYPYMVGGLDILQELFKRNNPSYYPHMLAQLVLGD